MDNAKVNRMYTQLIPFSTSKGGNVPLECLENVSLGFSIGAKYATAWGAWQHTQQHFDPIPDGLDVPLFYSYTTTIDGVTENYGHINVRLKNGTVWSDGNIYPSKEAYMSNHLPKYVGWGLSVNDFKIIGDNMAPQLPFLTEKEVRDAFAAYRVQGTGPNGEPGPEQIKGYTTENPAVMYSDLMQYEYDRRVEAENAINFTPYSGAQLFVKKG